MALSTAGLLIFKGLLVRVPLVVRLAARARLIVVGFLVFTRRLIFISLTVPLLCTAGLILGIGLLLVFRRVATGVLLIVRLRRICLMPRIDRLGRNNANAAIRSIRFVCIGSFVIECHRLVAHDVSRFQTQFRRHKFIPGHKRTGMRRLLELFAIGRIEQFRSAGN